MFGYIRGIILGIEESHITVLVEGTGLGLDIAVSPVTLAHVSSHGTAVELWMHHHIAEGNEALYGFRTREERGLFRRLIRVSGVGGRTALSLLGLGATALAHAIQTEDEKALSRVPGIGKKTALKLLVELRGSLPSLPESETARQTTRRPHAEIRETLVAMGYDGRSVESILAAMPEDLVTIQDRTVYALRMLASIRAGKVSE